MVSKYIYKTNIVKTRALQLAEEQLNKIEKLREKILQVSKNEVSQSIYDPMIELAKNAGISLVGTQLRAIKDQKIRNERTFRDILNDISKQQDRLDEIIARELRQGAEEVKRKEERQEQEQRWARTGRS